MKVVALDLSLTSTGVASGEGTEVLVPPSGLAGCERLGWLREAVLARCADRRWVDENRKCRIDRLDLVVIEGYAYGRVNAAHQIGELGGVIRLALWDEGIPFVDVPPANLKKYATGRGNAGKDEVLAAAIRRLGYEGHSHDEADARWLLEMAEDALGLVEPVVPMAHREALAAVEWPSPVMGGGGG